MPYLTASDGVRLYYELEGVGPPLVLHLGAGCDLELWRAAGYAERLAPTHRCILFDHRGHGRSDHPAGGPANHIDRYASDVLQLLDALELESVSFWGYSNAVAVGLKVAEAHPDRINRLVMSGTLATHVPSDEELAGSAERAIANYESRGWEWVIDSFAEDEGPAPDWMQARIRATPLEGAVGWAAGRPSWGWSSWEALARVDAPGLFVVGELEDPDDEMAAAAARMPNGQRIRVPGAGHINGFLDASFVTPHVVAFLEGSPARWRPAHA